MITVQPFFNYTSFCPEVISPIFTTEAQYLFLEDHVINGVYFLAGTTAFADGVIIPFNWVPTPNVDPLNSVAVTAFYNAGPRDLGLVRVQWVFINVPPPITYWKQISPNTYVLTGLGAALPPKFAKIPHPVGNIPQ